MPTLMNRFRPAAVLLAVAIASSVRAEPFLYLSDNGIGFSRIQKLDTNGTAIDSITTTATGFATSMAVDTSGNLYAAFNFTSGTIHKYTPTFTDLGVFYTNSLAGLAFDRAGYLYGAAGNSIYKISPAGVSTLFASDTNGQPVALAFDNAGNLYAANSSTHSVQKFSTNGVDLGIFADTGGLAHPNDLVIDGSGYLYVSTADAQTVLKFKPDGSYDSDFAAANMISAPTSMEIDGGGNLYLQGQDTHHTVARFTADGQRQYLVTGGLGSSGALAITPVPEPSVFALGTTGLLAAAAMRWRNRRPVDPCAILNPGKLL